MPGTERPLLQVVAMHGWAGDSRCWQPWIAETQSLGWHWQCGERGYGEMKPRRASWPESPQVPVRRVVVGHSLGPHLLPPEVLRSADDVVLMASFASFVSAGRAGRRTRAALAGMSASLVDENRARAMLGNFMSEAADPAPLEFLPPGPLDGPLDKTSLGRLREDLDLLGSCAGLPSGFPSGARVLIVEAGRDRIVDPEARKSLLALLPQATMLRLDSCGHALLGADVMPRVIEWVESGR